MKIENKRIREIWKKVVVEMYGENSNMRNIFYYNNKIKNGSKKIFKSYGWVGWEKVWKEVNDRLKSENIEGWDYFESSSFRGDGSVSGIFKVGE
jgi:hypothetical protein